MRFFLFVFLSSLIPFTATAEEFLGIEDENSPAEDTPVEQEQAPTARGSGGGTWGGSGGLSPGLNQFRAALTISYGFNRYVGIDTHAYYNQFKNSDTSGKMYGPEVDLVLRLANPTILTPFVGAGLGYDKWARTYDDELFDDSSSAIATAFGGLSINLTKHFGIQGTRKQKVYLSDPPVSFSDRTTKEPTAAISNYIGFVIMF